MLHYTKQEALLQEHRQKREGMLYFINNPQIVQYA